jgi:hypothetical protein
LVLTLGSSPKKGGKKNPGINLGQRHLKYIEASSTIHSKPAGKGRKKKGNKKTLVLTLGSLPEKGGKYIF